MTVQRSGAYLFYDFALLVIALVPFALIVALVNGRSKAAAIYGLTLGVVIVSAFVVNRVGNLKLRSYWRSLASPTDC